jgi:hypothetical protein
MATVVPLSDICSFDDQTLPCGHRRGGTRTEEFDVMRRGIELIRTYEISDPTQGDSHSYIVRKTRLIPCA